MRKSFRASVLLAEGLADEFADSLASSGLGSSISEEPNFRSLLNIFEGQIKENGSQANIPSMFRQEACS